jgi:pimeloyl-ACP methyl ester carboxylesterase
MTCPRVIFLDGAGWYSGDGPVREGLRRGGFDGQVERFSWQSLLGPLHDHVTADENHPRVRDLARRITDLREANPDGRIVVVGYSAGTSLVVSALERLDGDVAVDHVVLLASSVPGRHDLTEALRHVRRQLYSTWSRHDSLLASSSCAGLRYGRPAGYVGFTLPAIELPQTRRLFRKVVHLSWRPGYLAYGWDGGHMSVTSPEFIRAVIAPRILADSPHPLDRPLVGEKVARRE